MKRNLSDVRIAVVACVLSLAVLASGDRLVIGAIVVVITAILLVLASRANHLALVWFTVVAICPPWISLVAMGVRIPIATVISVGIIAVMGHRTRLKAAATDHLVLLAAIFTIVAAATSHTPPHIATQVLFEWAACYVAGRYLASVGYAICDIANRLAGLIGALAILQFITRINVASIFPFEIGSSDSFWAALQERGGMVRAELTFGHSIALGGSLTILIAFGLASRARGAQILTGLGICGTVATLSRSAIVAAIICLGLSVLLSSRSRLWKAGLTTILAGIALVVYRMFNDAASSSGNLEIHDSTQYREGLNSLWGIVRPLGLAPGGSPANDGSTYRWGTFYSIDNGLLFIALYAGAIVCLLVTCSLLYTLVRSWQARTRNPVPLVLLLSQIPLLLTVAPICQYQNYFWLAIGICVTWTQARGEEHKGLGRQGPAGYAEIVQGVEIGARRHKTDLETRGE